MSLDVFSRKTDVYGGGFAADQCVISFPKIGDNGGEIGLLIQRLGITYQQQITRLYEVGHEAIYYVGGRTSGEIAVDRVIGPKVISVQFYTTYGDLCNARTNTLDLSVQTGCAPAGKSFDAFSTGVRYTAHMCVITSIGVTIAAQDMLINESLRIMTSNLQYQEFPVVEKTQEGIETGFLVTPGKLG